MVCATRLTQREQQTEKYGGIMMKRRQDKKIILVATALSLLAIFTAFFPRSADAAPAKQKIIGVALTNAPRSMSGYTVVEGAQWAIMTLFFDSLYKVNDFVSYDKYLAEDVITNDNQTFTVKLRRDAYWTDGKPITADDAVYTIYLYANPVVNSTFSQYFNFVQGLNTVGRLDEGQTEISGLKKIDDYTFEITTKFPVSMNFFLANIGTELRPLPKHVFEKFDLDNLAANDFNNNPTVTSGAYIFEEHAVDQFVRFKTNPNYYKGAPKVDGVVVKILTAPNILVQLQSGEVDFNINGVGNISIDDYDTLKNLTNVDLKIKEAAQVQQLEISTESFPDPRVRKAISLAINRDLIVNQLLRGMGAPIYNVFPPSAIFNNKDIIPKYDPQEAKALLEEAGFDGAREFIFAIPTGNQKREQAGEIIAQNLNDIGIKVKIEKADYATSNQKMKEGAADMFIRSNAPYEHNPINGLTTLYGTGGTANLSRLSDKTVDDLCTSALAETDNEKQIALVNQIQARLYEIGNPAVGVYAESQLQGINKRMRNVNWRLFNTVSNFGNAYEWEIVE
jgi:peptide/nickel transport system substrate-binding protein